MAVEIRTVIGESVVDGIVDMQFLIFVEIRLVTVMLLKREVLVI